MIIIIDIRYNAGIGTYIFYTIRNKTLLYFETLLKKYFCIYPFDLLYIQNKNCEILAVFRLFA